MEKKIRMERVMKEERAEKRREKKGEKLENDKKGRGEERNG